MRKKDISIERERDRERQRDREKERQTDREEAERVLKNPHKYPQGSVLRIFQPEGPSRAPMILESDDTKRSK